MVWCSKALTFVTINEIFCNNYNCLCERNTQIITCRDLPDLGKMHMATIIDVGVYHLKMLRPQNPFLMQSIEKYFKSISVMNLPNRHLDKPVTDMDTATTWFYDVTTALPQSIEKYFKSISAMNVHNRGLDTTKMDTATWFYDVTTPLPTMVTTLDKNSQATTIQVFQETCNPTSAFVRINSTTTSPITTKHMGNTTLIFTILTGMFIGIIIGLIICCSYYQKKYRNVLFENRQRRNQIFLEEI